MWVKNCIRHRLSLMGGDSYSNALLTIKGCYPQQRWSDCVCTGGKTRLWLLAEQTAQQGNQGNADQSDTAVLKIQRMMSAGSNCAMLLCWVIISINS